MTSLNHVFRTIWSEALGAWIAVSEITKSRGKRSASSLVRTIRAEGSAFAVERSVPGILLKPVLLAVACCFAINASANPIGGTVVNGQASFSTAGNTLTVTNTPGTIINWQGFSIGANEATHFAQQSASSTVLNRVVTNTPSVILGKLSSNGQVYLVNANGIMFGAGSTVDVAGLVATTLNLSDADFLAGKHNYTAVTGAGNVGNAGNINAQQNGFIYLIAPNVENTGIITAPSGEILLAAGSEVQLVNSLDPNLRVSITAPAGNATNLGQLIAESGSLGLFGTMVKNSGLVSADSATMQGGKIVFKASNSTILDAGSITSATGTTGGTIAVQGNNVGLIGNAKVDASGTNGGGTVLVGGDAHGANPSVQNSQLTYVDSGATIKADATQSGNGGKVVVWSDNATQFVGNISARGGALSGNGGWVETSGKQWLGFAGLVDTTAAYGTTGSLLLDPVNITINTAASTGTMQWNGVTFTFADVATGGVTTSNLNVTTLTTQLGLTNVTVDTTAPGLGVGNIDVQAPIAWASANSLTLKATGTGAITTTAGSTITNTGTGGLTMTTASGGVTLNGGVSLAGGPFNINASGPGTSDLLVNAAVSTGAGGMTWLAGRNITIANGISVTSTGDVNMISGWNNSGWAVTGGTGNISFGTSSLSTAGNIWLAAGNSITQSVGSSITANGLGIGGDVNGGPSLPGGVSLAGPNMVNTLAVDISPRFGQTAAGSLTFSNGKALTIGTVLYATGIAATANTSAINITTTAGDIIVSQNVASAGPVSLTAAGAITESGATGLINTTGLLTTKSATGTTLNGTNSVGSFNATNTTSGSIALTNTAASMNITGMSNAGGNVTLNSSGTVTQSAGINVAGLELLGAGSYTLTNSTNSIATLAGNAGSISLVDSTALSVGTVNTAGLTSTGAISLTSGGAISQTAAINSSGLTTSSAGGTTLNGANTVTSFSATNTASGNISLTNTAATLTALGLNNTAAGGSVALNNAGSISIMGTIAAAGGGAINLTSLGSISEGSTGQISTSGLLTTSSVSGQTLVPPSTNTVGSFNATNSKSGTINFSNVGTTLTVTGVSQIGSGAVTIINGGDISTTGAITTSGTAATTVNLVSSGNITVGNTVTGTGGGAVDLTLVHGSTGSATLAGNLSLAGGNLDAQNVNGVGTGTLNVAAGAISNSGALTAATLVNNGSIFLSGTGGSVAGTLIQNGLLDIAAGGMLAAPSFINTGTLSGGGTLNLGTGTITNNGTIAPGGVGAVGMLSITGNLVMGATGVLNIDINSPAAGNYDELIVSGTASLTGGTMNIVGGGIAGTYDVLSATGGFGGTKFAAINSGGLTYTSNYTANILELKYGIGNNELSELVGETLVVPEGDNDKERDDHFASTEDAGRSKAAGDAVPETVCR